MSRANLKTFILFLLSIIVPTGFLYAQVPERSISGQTLQVSDQELDAGMIYHIWPGEDTHLIIESEAYLQRVAVTTNRMVGYVVVPFELEPSQEKPLIGGAFRIPVASLKSGIDGGDSILTSQDFFDAGNYREIGFKIRDITDTNLITQNETTIEIDAQLHGTLYVKESMFELTIPVQLKFLPSKFRLYSRSLGDVLLLSGDLPLNLADLGWKPKADMKDKVAQELKVDIFMMLTTISPDKSADPRDHPVYYPRQLRFKTLLRDLDDPDSAYAFGEVFMTEIWDNDKELVKLADSVYDIEVLRPKYPFALKALERAVELTNQSNHQYMQELAAVYHQMGNIQSAIHWQRKVVNMIGESETEDAMAARSTLNRYEKEAQ